MAGGKIFLSKRRRGRKRRRRNAALVAYRPRAGINMPLPKQFKTTLKYGAIGTIDPGAAGTCAVNVFYLNNIYDVDYTNGLNDNQHRGRDELQSLYNHAFVIRQDIRISYGMTDNGVPNVIGASIQADNSADTLFLNYLENSATKYKLIGPNGPDTGQIKMTVYPHKFLGRKWDSTDLKNNAASSPTENCYLHVFASAVDGATDSTAVHLIVEMDTTVVFVEPKQPTQS